MRHALAAALLLLAGCATAVEDARDLHQAGRGYVADNIEWRKTLRRICQEITLEQITILRRDGKYDEAKELARRNHPDLVIARIVKQAIDDPAGLTSEPFGCQ